ncbi:hypothetical protein niasHS_011120 [Heterodera schachtii]|uniref:Uncharacterized protein n=2 Tax=Heterodera TaxID=34509 RepID=A0ABD2J3W4_HETSC
MFLLIALLLVAFPLFGGAIPALPNSAAALTQQQQRMMQIDAFSAVDDAQRKESDAAGGAAPFAFEPSEQKAFVLKGLRRVKNPSPPAVVPKLTADAKIIALNADDDEWRGMGRQQKQQQQHGIGRLLPPTDSLARRMSGAAAAVGTQRAQRPTATEAFGDAANGGDALINPAAFFMGGADLDRIAAPSCHLMGCVGPLANDGDIALEGRTGPGAGGTRQCHQTFVPLNGCWERGAGRDSYPVGMVCTICCECSAQLAAEMRRSRGWTNGYRIGQ